MDEIDCNILNAIKSLRESKQQPNEVSIFKLLSADDDEKPVDRGIFQQHLEKLVSLEKLINRPCNRRNSYYIVNPTETTGELNVIDQPITIEPEQDKFFEPKLDNNENYTQNNSENDIVENKIRVLTAEIEAVKLFMKEQIYLLKKVVEEKNFKAENEGNTMLIELLCRQIKSLTDENASKNEIIKILAENQKQHPSTSEKFIEVKGKNNNKTIEKTKYQLQLSNRFDVLDTESNDSEHENVADVNENTSEGANEEVNSSFSNVSSRRKKRSKTPKKRQNPQKKSPTPQIEHKNAINDENSTKQQHRTVPRNLVASYSNAVTGKSKNIVLLSDSILKRLRMAEFNRWINNGVVRLKSFPGTRAKQLDHHSIPVLEEHSYDAAIIHVGINDLLRSTEDLEEICKDIISIGVRCQDHNIGTIFISGITNSSKISQQTTERMNELLKKACTKHGYKFIDNIEVSNVNLWKDGIHLLESGMNVIANNMIRNVNHFLGRTTPFRWSQTQSSITQDMTSWGD